MTLRRKLFMTHAGELAHRLVRAVRPDGLVLRFATSYARQNGRQGVADDPQRIPELESSLGRELLLVMVTEVRRLLPAALGAAKRRSLGPAEAAFAEAFWPEFMASLGRALEWPSADATAEREAFDRDLLMYARRTGPLPAGIGNPMKAAVSPFWDRCALLLDPAMMDEARAASVQFEKEAVRAAAQILGRLGRTAPRASNAHGHGGRPRPSKRRPARQPRKQKPKTRSSRRRRPS